MLNTNEKIIKHKVGLLNLAEELGNVSKACQMMGMSRDTFYRYKSAVDDGGVEALFERTRRKPNLANRVDQAVEDAVKGFALDFPAHGQTRTSNELRKLGVFVSPSGVRSIWLRHDLANFKDRLKALEAKIAAKGGILTEAQVQALEKKKLDDEACGEIETAHPGYLGSQDTFYVGTLKGVGRVYQQTYVDTYCKVAHAKLYTTKTPITAADMLNDKVLPFYEEHDLPVLRILTDRGTEYCGRVDKHDYQLFLAINDIPSHGLLHKPLSGDGSHKNQGEITPDQRHLRAVSQDDLAGVLPDHVPQKTLRKHRSFAGRSGRMAGSLQHPTNSSGQNVLRTHPV